MLNAKEELQEAIRRAGGLKSLRVGRKMIVYCGNNAEEVEANAVKEAIRSGVAIYWPNGIREFYEWVPVFHCNKEGSLRYEWHQDGNRCRHWLMRVVEQKDGKLSKQGVRFAWRKLEN